MLFTCFPKSFTSRDEERAQIVGAGAAGTRRLWREPQILCWGGAVTKQGPTSYHTLLIITPRVKVYGP